MIYTDNSETLKNALAKIEELEAKLAIAIEALEEYAELYPTPDEIAVEALNKIRSE